MGWLRRVNTKHRPANFTMRTENLSGHSERRNVRHYWAGKTEDIRIKKKLKNPTVQRLTNGGFCGNQWPSPLRHLATGRSFMLFRLCYTLPLKCCNVCRIISTEWSIFSAWCRFFDYEAHGGLSSSSSLQPSVTGPSSTPTATRWGAGRRAVSCQTWPPAADSRWCLEATAERWRRSQLDVQGDGPPLGEHYCGYAVQPVQCKEGRGGRPQACILPGGVRTVLCYLWRSGHRRHWCEDLGRPRRRLLKKA